MKGMRHVVPILALAMAGCGSGQRTITTASDITFRPTVVECATYPRSDNGNKMFPAYRRLVHELPNVDHALTYESRAHQRKAGTMVSDTASVSIAVEGLLLDSPSGVGIELGWLSDTPEASKKAVIDLGGTILERAVPSAVADEYFGWITAEMARQEPILAIGGSPTPACKRFSNGMIAELRQTVSEREHRTMIVLSATTPPQATTL